VSACERELFRLDVDAEQSNARKLLTEDGQDGADAAADLEQACTGLEPSSVADQPVTPVLRLLDEPLLLARAVAVDVLGDALRLGTAPHPARPSR
jgi:hypothetical protein